jgi:hypothetical protein
MLHLRTPVSHMCLFNKLKIHGGPGRKGLSLPLQCMTRYISTDIQCSYVIQHVFTVRSILGMSGLGLHCDVDLVSFAALFRSCSILHRQWSFSSSTHMHVCFYSDLKTCAGEAMGGIHVHHREYSSKFPLMGVNAKTHLSTRSGNNDMDKLPPKGRHATGLRG